MTGPATWRDFVQCLFLGGAIVGCGSDESGAYYAPPPDAEYAAEEVKIMATDGREIAGTLTLPPRGQPTPVLVMVTGSGLQDRDQYIRGVGLSYRPFRQIADTLTRRGIATLRMDDPGIGGSDPFPPNATPFSYAEDIRAALDFLRDHSGIDSRRMAVLGHSEGAVVAPLVAASDSTLAAMVLLAAPAFTLERVSRFQRTKRWERETDLSPEKIEAEIERNTLAAERAAARDPWRKAVWAYDPLPTAASVDIPVLLLHGEQDQKITPDQSDTLAAAFRDAGNPDVTVHFVPETNHFFLRTPKGRARRSDQIAPQVLGVVADWLADRLQVEER